MRQAEDFDLWLRMVKQRGCITYLRRPIYYVRVRPGSLVSHPVKVRESILQILEKYGKLFTLSGQAQAALDEARKQITAELDLYRGKQALSEGDVPSAIRDIASAKRFRQKWKLNPVLALMKTEPGLFRPLARMSSWQSP